MQFKPDSWDFVAGFGAHTRDMLATVLDQSEDCVKILDPEGRIGFMNRNGRCSMEVDDFGAVAGKPWETLWPEEAARRVRDGVRDALAGESSRFEAFCPTAKGTPKWWDVRVSPVRDESGVVLAILSVSRDVTQHHHAMESLHTMAHEMRHRLRNAYAVSGAIALASGREDPAFGDFSEALANRLNSLSAVQGSLIDPGEELLPALVARIAEAYARDGALIRCERLPPVKLGEQAVRLLALVLGELATNSLKHGALRRDMPITISAAQRDGVLALDWREPVEDGSAGQSPATEGSGFRLMQRMARAHRGSFTIVRERGVLTAHLEVPFSP